MGRHNANKLPSGKPKGLARGPSKLSLRDKQFAQLILAGSTQEKAYRVINPGCSGKTAFSAGCRIANKPAVKAYIEELRQASWTAEALSIAEKRAYLGKIVRTPVGEVDETSPLAQEVKYEQTKYGENKTIKMPSKLQAIEIDSRLAGDFYSDREGNNGNPFGWLVVMHKNNSDKEMQPVIEIGNSSAKGQ